MMNNLNILKEWLNSNGFKKEAIELNNLVVSSNVLYKSAWAGGPYTLGGATNLEEAKEWNRKNLGGGGLEMR